MMGAGNWKPSNKAEDIINECSTERNNVHPELSYLHVLNPWLKILKLSIYVSYCSVILWLYNHMNGAAWLNCQVMELGWGSIDTLPHECIRGGIINCRKLNPGFSFQKDGQNVKVFPAVISFELLCLSVSSLPLHSFCRYQHILHQLVIAHEISLWYSSQELIVSFVSSELLIFESAHFSSPGC